MGFAETADAFARADDNANSSTDSGNLKDGHLAATYPHGDIINITTTTNTSWQYNM